MKSLFLRHLTATYTELFTRPSYALAAHAYTPEQLATAITEKLPQGKATADGEGIRRTCRTLGIPHNEKAIRDYLKRNN